MGRMKHAIGVRPDILTFAMNVFKSYASGKCQNIRPDTNGMLHPSHSVALCVLSVVEKTDTQLAREA